ncbi:hypothetical protein HNV11_10605 [Spirosoma taeanense]|uniref:Molecular chaperone n=1 Tax=Spirosoma taeanense TaxID=2735870 RepID=A0A6M5Y7B7_9BACT|nr:hypothetical protein [Spirosoma taeanense]QJW89795.1 hypothetical protein HNV11_10605 [Spirosoma taeanense]
MRSFNSNDIPLFRFLFLFLAITSRTFGQAGFQVEPPKVYFEEKNNKLAPVRIKVTNPSAVRMVIRASCVDWRRDSLGEKQFHPAGSLPSSCCPYLRVQPETVELEPGSQQEVLVSLNPDKLGNQQLRNGMLMLTQINEREIAEAQGRKSGFIFKVQIGVHLYHIPAAVKLKTMEIDTLFLSHNKEVQQLQVRVRNAGELDLESQLRVELTNLQTAEEIKLPPVPVNTMPGERIWLKTLLPEKLAKGRYLIIAIIDSGTDIPLQVAELETDMP